MKEGYLAACSDSSRVTRLGCVSLRAPPSSSGQSVMPGQQSLSVPVSIQLKLSLLVLATFFLFVLMVTGFLFDFWIWGLFVCFFVFQRYLEDPEIIQGKSGRGQGFK